MLLRRKLDLRRTRNLCRKGVRSLVLESSPSLRASGFAFTTWKNAFRALDALGVGDKIREQHLQAQAYVPPPPYLQSLLPIDSVVLPPPIAAGYASCLRLPGRSRRNWT